MKKMKMKKMNVVKKSLVTPASLAKTGVKGSGQFVGDVGRGMKSLSKWRK